jgi:hypothetical protein
MVRDLFNGDDNCNYFIDNQRFGSGTWGRVSDAVYFNNRDGSGDIHGETLQSLKTFFVPWHPIPLELIGPYERPSDD